MTLIKSISGIRGTIGGKPGEGLSPLDTLKFTAAYGQWLIIRSGNSQPTVVLGRDARISGEMVDKIVTGTLMGLGIHVVNANMATTPTIEVAVTELQADGGIILTASHNPKQWNALKLLNEKGEFLSADDGARILEIANNEDFSFADVDALGTLKYRDDLDDLHIKKILKLPLVDTELIAHANFKVVIDCVNSVGGVVIPKLLKALGVKQVVELFCEPNGVFPHNPEPLPEHLNEISETIKKEGADVGFVVDPDVDRLAIVNEDGSMFGEEYTLVAVSDYVLSEKAGNTVSNLSSTRALKDVTEKHGAKYFAAAVGEVNVVSKMKETEAIIGGEGNGGVIYPALHYGRDALVGIALFLTQMAKAQKKCSGIKAQYPLYTISKNKIQLTSVINVDSLLENVQAEFAKFPVNTIDGVKIEFENGWVHLRKSNTEPIIRIYAEGRNTNEAETYAQSIIDAIKKFI